MDRRATVARRSAPKRSPAIANMTSNGTRNVLSLSKEMLCARPTSSAMTMKRAKKAASLAAAAAANAGCRWIRAAAVFLRPRTVRTRQIMIAAMTGPAETATAPLSRMNGKLLEIAPAERRHQRPGSYPDSRPPQIIMRDHAPPIEAGDIGEAEHQIERLVARQAGLQIAQNEHRKHGTAIAAADGAIGPHSRHRRRSTDQAPEQPDKGTSSMPTAWVTMAAAIALEAAMTRNGRGGAQRSMHKAHTMSTTSAATSSWSF